MRWLYLGVAVAISSYQPVEELPIWARAFTWICAGGLVGLGYRASENKGVRAGNEAWDAYPDKMHNRVRGDR